MPGRTEPAYKCTISAKAFMISVPYGQGFSDIIVHMLNTNHTSLSQRRVLCFFVWGKPLSYVERRTENLSSVLNLKHNAKKFWTFVLCASVATLFFFLCFTFFFTRKMYKRQTVAAPLYAKTQFLRVSKNSNRSNARRLYAFRFFPPPTGFIRFILRFCTVLSFTVYFTFAALPCFLSSESGAPTTKIRNIRRFWLFSNGRR